MVKKLWCPFIDDDCKFQDCVCLNITSNYECKKLRHNSKDWDDCLYNIKQSKLPLDVGKHITSENYGYFNTPGKMLVCGECDYYKKYVWCECSKADRTIIHGFVDEIELPEGCEVE